LHPQPPIDWDQLVSLVAEFGSVDPVDLVDLVVAKCLVVALASLDSKSLVVAVVAWALPMWMEGLVSWNTLESPSSGATP